MSNHPQWRVAPFAVARKPNTLDVFAVDHTGQVLTAWWHGDGEWSSLQGDWDKTDGWKPLGGNLWDTWGGNYKLIQRVTGVSRTPESIDLFAVADDGKVYTAWWHGGGEWSSIPGTSFQRGGWKEIGGDFPLYAEIAAVSRTPDAIDLFAVGADGRMYTAWWHGEGEWSSLRGDWAETGGWKPIGGLGLHYGGIDAVSRGPESIDLFAAAKDGNVYTAWWRGDGDWSSLGGDWKDTGGWKSIGGSGLVSPLVAVARSSSDLDVFTMGPGGQFCTAWWHGTGDWSSLGGGWKETGGWKPLGGPPVPPVDEWHWYCLKAIARKSNTIDLFTVGADGRAYTAWWHGDGEWSSLRGDWSSSGGWKPLGGKLPPGAPIAAVSRDPESLDLFAIDLTPVPIGGTSFLKGRMLTAAWNGAGEWSSLQGHWPEDAGWRLLGGDFDVPYAGIGFGSTGTVIDKRYAPVDVSVRIVRTPSYVQEATLRDLALSPGGRPSSTAAFSGQTTSAKVKLSLSKHDLDGATVTLSATVGVWNGAKPEAAHTPGPIDWTPGTPLTIEVGVDNLDGWQATMTSA